LFSPGGDVFGAFCMDGAGGGAYGRGIAGLVQRPDAEAEFGVATRFRPRTVASLEEVLPALDVVGESAEFPLATGRASPCRSLPERHIPEQVGMLCRSQTIFASTLEPVAADLH
jgi:hypothetical protein